MKILLDGRLYGLEHAGVGRYLVHLVAELQKIDKKNEYVILLRKKYFSSLNLPKNWKKILTDFGVYGLSEQVKLPGIIRSVNPDLTHFPHFNVPLVGHGRYVVTLHDMTMHKQGVSATKLNHLVYFVKKMIYKVVFKVASKNSLKIITPSLTVKSEVEERYNLEKNKIITIYEGFDSAIWNGNHKLDVLLSDELRLGNYFIYVGSLFPHKNINRLISALYILNKQTGLKCRLVVIGSKNLFLGTLVDYIAKKKLENYVSIMGFVKDEDVSTLMKNSIGFIYPSLSEGFGLQGLEAMSSGALVLSSDIPVFREIYETNSIYFDPLSPLDMAKKMEKTIKLSKKDRAQKVARAKEFIKRYSWTKMAKETLKVYESLKVWF